MLNWDTPQYLQALFLLVPMGFLLLRMQHRLRLRRARFADPELLEEMEVRFPEARETVRLGLVVVAFACMVIAAGGPRLGGTAAARLPGEVPSLAIGVDTSKSMAVRDVGQSRMDEARDGLSIIVDNLSDWRAGLVAFADDALVFCPMTTDLSAVKTLWARLKPAMPELKQGTNLEVALRTCLEALHGRPGAILLATDGEPLAGDVTRAAAEAQKASVPVYCLMVGTSQGGPIPDGTDPFGQPIFRMRAGTEVLSHADPSGLAELSKRTGGLYVDASTPGAAERILGDLRSRFGADGVGSEGIVGYQVPLALGVLLLLVAWLLEHPILLSFGSRLRLSRAVTRLRPFAGLLLAFCALSQMAWTWPWAGLAAIHRAEKAYQAGHWSAAAKTLASTLGERPGDASLAYDLGCARYQAGDYAGAVKAFSQALEHLSRDPKAEARVRYNVGNAFYRLGEAKGRRRDRWKRAIDQYQAALRLDPTDKDARYNLELVTKRLKELPPEKKPAGAGASKQPNSAPQEGAGTPLPSENEIQATLDALQHEEQQHQAELNPPPTQAPPTSASDLMKQLLKQAANGDPTSDRPDW